jgi:hypothetical protein
MFHRNIRLPSSVSKSKLSCLLVSDPEDETHTFLQNASELLPDCTALSLRRLKGPLLIVTGMRASNLMLPSKCCRVPAPVFNRTLSPVVRILLIGIEAECGSAGGMWVSLRSLCEIRLQRERERERELAGVRPATGRLDADSQFP